MILLSFLYEPEIDVKRDVVSNVDVDWPSMVDEFL